MPEQIQTKKQTAKRHFGVHGYFTRQSWDLVQAYIKTFSQPGDLVLDPYGGSGVTLVEALMLNRKAIHIDLNPLSEFIVRNLIQPIDVAELYEAFEDVCKQVRAKLPKNDKELAEALKKYPYPKGIRLPKGSDVEYIEQLFSDKQLAELAILKAIILKQKNQPIRDTLLLMFSGLINKVNLTYHSSKGRSEGRGDSAVFRYYRHPHGSGRINRLDQVFRIAAQEGGCGKAGDGGTHKYHYSGECQGQQRDCHQPRDDL